MRWMAAGRRGWLGALAVGVSSLLGACGASGPTVGVRNDSDTAINARFYVGQREAGVAGLTNPRKGPLMRVGPRQSSYDTLGFLSGYSSTEDSVVQVRLEPLGPSFEGRREYWFELLPPGPYTIRAIGKSGTLTFERLSTRGRLVEVPREFWLP